MTEILEPDYQPYIVLSLSLALIYIYINKMNIN